MFIFPVIEGTPRSTQGHFEDVIYLHTHSGCVYGYRHVHSHRHGFLGKYMGRLCYNQTSTKQVMHVGTFIQTSWYRLPLIYHENNSITYSLYITHEYNVFVWLKICAINGNYIIYYYSSCMHAACQQTWVYAWVHGWAQLWLRAWALTFREF